MDNNTFISFHPYNYGIFPVPVCLPDHEAEFMKKHATPVLDFCHGKGDEDMFREEKIPKEPGFKLDEKKATEHYLLYNASPEERDFYLRFKNRGVYCAYSGWDWHSHYDIHHHSTMYVTLPIMKSAVYFYSSIRDNDWLGMWKGDFMSSVGMYFYRYNMTFRKELEYYRMLFKHAKFTSVRMIMPDIKAPRFENVDHYLEVGFVYQYVLYLHPDGYLFYETRNDEVYQPSDRRIDFKDPEPEPVEEVVEKPPFTLNFQSITMVEPENGFEVNKPFRCKINTIMSRKLDVPERKMGYLGCALESTYKGKLAESITTCDGDLLNTDGNVEVGFFGLAPHPDWKNDKNKDPDNPPLYRVRVENKHAPGLFGYSDWVEVPKPPKKIKLPGFYDCHVHTNPPKAAPLSTLWIQNWLAEAIKPDWNDDWKKLGGIDGPVLKPIAALFTNEMPKYSKDTTEQLGIKVLDESNKALRDAAVDKYMVPSGERKRVLIDLPIDIEMAHYRGYEGIPVYETNENGEKGCWLYEGHGKRVWHKIPNKEVQKLPTFYDQKSGIKSLFNANQGYFLSFFPFDPRHWLGEISTYSLGDWKGTLENIISVSQNKETLNQFAAIGYKLYTALGYRPDDYKDLRVTSVGSIPQIKNLEHKLPDLFEFYATCAKNKIPITCHCSRGGVFAHDFMLYYDYLFPADDATKQQKMEYFHENYVSPFAWERVLENFNDLYLNLAHFGGEEEWATLEGNSMPWAEKMAEMASNPLYPNFYIDLSYFLFRTVEVADCEKGECDLQCSNRGKIVPWDVKCPMSAYREIIPAKIKLAKMLKSYPKLKEKLLFGTDWYLISGEEKQYGHYNDYFKRSIQMLAEIDPELPAYTMVINPKRYLNLAEVSKKMVNIFGEDFEDLCNFVTEKMHDSIEKYYQ